MSWRVACYLWMEEGCTCLAGAGWYIVCQSKTVSAPDLVHDKLSTTTLESLSLWRLGDGEVWAVAVGLTLRELI